MWFNMTEFAALMDRRLRAAVARPAPNQREEVRLRRR
jgi:hypothetical protein